LAPSVSRYRAVLFDALGTLVDLEPPWPALRSTLERRHGIEVTEAEAKEAMLAEMSYYREHHAEGADADSLAGLRRRCAAVLRERLPAAGTLGLEEMTELLLDSLRFAPYPDAAPTLATLREAGLRLAVVSNWDCSLERVLSQVGLGAALDTVVVSAQAGMAKPDPAIFTLALERLRRRPGEALFVGDSLETDVAGASRAGLRPILIDRAGAAAGDPDLELVATLADLPPLLGLTP
jgi:putative hydrolase of the HAD superfamily